MRELPADLEQFCENGAVFTYNSKDVIVILRSCFCVLALSSFSHRAGGANKAPILVNFYR
jgi:hypothetical protein